MFAAFDLKDFYLGHNLPRSEYIGIPLSIIPQEIIDAYNLHDYAHNGYIYAKVDKGMYGLPQAGRVASDALIPQLAADGYYPTGRTPGLFKHKTNSIIFALVVDDFGIQYSKKADAIHLLKTLRKYYTVTTYWTGANFCGIDLKWDYINRTCQSLEWSLMCLR